MSPSIYVRVRVTQKGERRFNIRYRIHGRQSMLLNGGTFGTMKETNARVEFIRMEIAAGRDPRETLLALAAKPAPQNIQAWWDQWANSRVDVSSRTNDSYEIHRKRIIPVVGRHNPSTFTPDDVQDLITALTTGRKPLGGRSVKKYVATLAMVLDYAGIEPNPVRSKRVKYPWWEEPLPNVPTKSDIITTRAFMPERWHLPLDVMEQGGFRIEEIQELEWGDIDEERCQIRIRTGKSKSARRRVDVPAWLIEKMGETCPREDRTPERRVFPGFNRMSCSNAVRRASTMAGVPSWSPHDLRHRYASIMAKRGVPRTDLARAMGHSKVSQLDVYEHVVLPDEEL